MQVDDLIKQTNQELCLLSCLPISQHPSMLYFADSKKHSFPDLRQKHCPFPCSKTPFHSQEFRTANAPFQYLKLMMSTELCHLRIKKDAILDHSDI